MKKNTFKHKKQLKMYIYSISMKSIIILSLAYFFIGITSCQREEFLATESKVNWTNDSLTIPFIPGQLISLENIETYGFIGAMKIVIPETFITNAFAHPIVYYHLSDKYDIFGIEARSTMPLGEYYPTLMLCVQFPKGTLKSNTVYKKEDVDYIGYRLRSLESLVNGGWDEDEREIYLYNRKFDSKNSVNGELEDFEFILTSLSSEGISGSLRIHTESEWSNATLHHKFTFNMTNQDNSPLTD